jgi:bifunctional ADP-heptose synthase (sugar kinase/adenylyltransferase)
MTGEKTSKLKEIKETVSGAAEIIRQIKTLGMQEYFGNIVGSARFAKEIIESLRSPEMVKNIENFRLISENINESSARMQNTIRQLEETGFIDEAKGLIRSATSATDSFSNSGQDLHEVSASIKEMIRSVRGLVDEFKITVIDSKKSGAIHNIEETVKDASEIYKTIFRHKDSK